MSNKITKSYAIKRIAELTEENEVLRNDVKFFKNEYQIRINSYKKFYEELLSAKDNEIKRLNKQSINFAIVELEKIKKYMELCSLREEFTCETESAIYQFLGYIEQQMKKLKEQ